MVTREPEQTRARILEAGEQVLYEHGQGNLRIDSVARTAGVNKRMIYHYFGDKQGLVDAVYRVQMDRLLGNPEPLHADTTSVLRGMLEQYGTAYEQPARPSPSAQQLCRAARILLPMLIGGHPPSPAATVAPRQWRRFAFEMISLALSEWAHGAFGARPGTDEYTKVSEASVSEAFVSKTVSKRSLTTQKPRFRMSSSSRSRD